jgi:Putative restriction endonuclease
VAGRNVDFAIDPPPDLIVEVDITHTDILKNQFYAQLTVPEFWRFNGQVLRIYQLQQGEYVEVDRSPLKGLDDSPCPLPLFAAVIKSHFFVLQRCKISSRQHAI